MQSTPATMEGRLIGHVNHQKENVMKFYNFEKSLVLDEQGDWNLEKMKKFLWDFSATFIEEYGGQNILPFTKGKSEDFADANGLLDSGTSPVLLQLVRLINGEVYSLWKNHCDNPENADEYIRMATDRDHHGQFIIELQTYHLYVTYGYVHYEPQSKNSRIYAKFLCTGLDIHYSDRRYKKD